GRSGRLHGGVRGRELRRGAPRGVLLRARDPGADAHRERERRTLHEGRERPLHRDASLLWRLSNAGRRRLHRSVRRGRLSSADLRGPVTSTPPTPRRVFAPDLMAGQVALVTGGGTGLGRAIAQGLAEAGAGLLLAARRPGA